MSMGIYLNSKDKIIPTVQDVYDWLNLVESFNVPRDRQLDDAVLAIYIPVDPTAVFRIQDGEHKVQDIEYDILINTHECDYHNKEKS